MESEVDSRLVSLTNGEWQAGNGPFEHFDGLDEADWSLLVRAINHWHMSAAELVCLFRILPDWRLDDLMISFSVPGGGVGPYIDQYDIFTIQGMDSRHWHVGDKLPMRQFRPHSVLLHVDPFPPIINEDLRPGDILHIPPRFPHDGMTRETALNYSVGFRGPSGRDLISGFVDYVLENDLGGEHYNNPDPTCREHPDRVKEHELGRLRTMMIDMIRQSEDFEQWFDSLVTVPRHKLDIVPAEPSCEEEEMVDVPLDGKKLSCLSGLRVLHIGDSFFVYNEQLDTIDAETLDALCCYISLGQREFNNGLQNPVFMSELTRLTNQGC